VWGQPPHELGRVPHAVLLAWQEGATTVVFGTGASERDGKKESDITVQYMYDRWDDLAQLHALKDVPLQQAKKMMQHISVDKLPIHDLVKRTFRVNPEQKADFLCELTALLEKYGV